MSTGNDPRPGRPDQDQEAADKRAWIILFGIITICFCTGIAVLVFAVWLDWT